MPVLPELARVLPSLPGITRRRSLPAAPADPERRQHRRRAGPEPRNPSQPSRRPSPAPRPPEPETASSAPDPRRISARRRQQERRQPRNAPPSREGYRSRTGDAARLAPDISRTPEGIPEPRPPAETGRTRPASPAAQAGTPSRPGSYR